MASPRPQLDTSESGRIDGSKPRTKGIRSAVPHKTVITPQRSRRCHSPYVVLRYTTLNLPHRTASFRGVQGNLIYDGRGRTTSHKEGALGENHSIQGRKGRASRQPARGSSRAGTRVRGCQPGAERPTDRGKKRAGEKKKAGERPVFYTFWIGFSACRGGGRVVCVAEMADFVSSSGKKDDVERRKERLFVGVFSDYHGRGPPKFSGSGVCRSRSSWCEVKGTKRGET